MIEVNIVVKNENLEKNKDLITGLFGNWNGKIEPPIQYIDTDKDMYDLLVMTKLFPSRGEAKKNWKRTGKEIPEGFSDFVNIGKLKNRLTIWRPI